MSINKADLRTSAKALRKTLHAQQPNAATALADRFPMKLLERFGPVVSGYKALGSELDPSPLLRKLELAGAEICFPRVESDTELSFRRAKTASDFELNERGIEEPSRSTKHVTPTLVLAPLLAFDAAGSRLGYGGGYYDRALAKLRSEGRVFVCGLAYAEQEVIHIPTEPTDISLDWLVTPENSIPLFFSKFRK